MFIRTDAAPHYVRLAGPPGAAVVVFANALGSDVRIWDEVIDLAGGLVRSVRYDMRGHGLTAPGPPPRTIRDLAGDLEQILESLRVRRAVVCGISVGGMVALQLAARRPDLAGGLILCDTGCRIGSAESWRQRIAAVEAGGLAAISGDIMARWFTEEYRRDRPDQVAGYRYMLERTPLAGYIGLCAALGEADLEAEARAIDCPTVVLCGDRDVATPPDLGRALAGAIRGARFDLVCGAGHLPCVERPAAVAAHVLARAGDQVHA